MPNLDTLASDTDVFSLEVGDETLDALERLDVDVLPLLYEALQADQTSTRARAAFVASCIDAPWARALVDPLRERLRHDTDPRVVFLAAAALATFGDASERVLAPLANALVSSSLADRRHALDALQHLGDDAASCTAGLRACLRCEEVAPRAARIVMRVAPELREGARQALARAIEREDHDTIWHLHELPDVTSPEVLQALCNRLARGSANGREDAAQALHRLAAKGRPIEAAVPALIVAMHGEDRVVADHALNALAAMGERALVPLTRALEFEDPELREAAEFALFRMGPVALEPLEVLAAQGHAEAARHVRFLRKSQDVEARNDRAFSVLLLVVGTLILLGMVLDFMLRIRAPE